MRNRKNRNWKKKQNKNKNRADKTIISQIILRLSDAESEKSQLEKETK
nr:MAG TPA: hypothetical protein [Caudoviricetes sp.]